MKHVLFFLQLELPVLRRISVVAPPPPCSCGRWQPAAFLSTSSGGLAVECCWWGCSQQLCSKFQSIAPCCGWCASASQKAGSHQVTQHLRHLSNLPPIQWAMPCPLQWSLDLSPGRGIFMIAIAQPLRNSGYSFCLLFLYSLGFSFSLTRQFLLIPLLLVTAFYIKLQFTVWITMWFLSPDWTPNDTEVLLPFFILQKSLRLIFYS